MKEPSKEAVAAVREIYAIRPGASLFTDDFRQQLSNAYVIDRHFQPVIEALEEKVGELERFAEDVTDR